MKESSIYFNNLKILHHNKANKQKNPRKRRFIYT